MDGKNGWKKGRNKRGNAVLKRVTAKIRHNLKRFSLEIIADIDVQSLIPIISITD
jgi:hypothetical protein